MLQSQRLEQMCIVIKQVVLLPFAWLLQAVTAHRNAHEPGVFQNKQDNI